MIQQAKSRILSCWRPASPSKTSAPAPEPHMESMWRPRLPPQSTGSLSWRPRPIQKGCLEAGGFVHRPLQRSRHRTPKRTLRETPLQCLDVAVGTIGRPHVHHQTPQNSEVVVASAKFANLPPACGLVLRGRLPCPEELVHLEASPRDATRTPSRAWLAPPWPRASPPPDGNRHARRRQELKRMLPAPRPRPVLVQGHFQVGPHQSGGRRWPLHWSVPCAGAHPLRALHCTCKHPARTLQTLNVSVHSDPFHLGVYCPSADLCIAGT